MSKAAALPTQIPPGLHSHFPEYDVSELDLINDANLIIQRTLEFGTWDETRWMFAVYGSQRIRIFLQYYGERMLRPVVFNYWRKLLRIRKWRHSPFPTPKGELWNL
jgi:hypothetical protein